MSAAAMALPPGATLVPEAGAEQASTDQMALPPGAKLVAVPAQNQEALGTGLTDALSNPTGWIPAATAAGAHLVNRLLPGAPLAGGFGYNDRASFETPESDAQTKAFVQDMHSKGKEAIDAFHAGDYAGAARHTADALGQYFGLTDQVKQIEKRIDSGDTRGAAGYGLGLLTQAAATAGVNRLMGWGGQKFDNARALDRSTMLQNAVVVHKNDADFLPTIEGMLPDVQRGAKLTGKPITDLPSTIEATEAAQHELMSALEDHKEVGRRQNLQLKQSDVRAAMKAAIPAGLPKAEREAIEAAIDEDHPANGVLQTDDVFDKARLNNSRTKQFYAGGEGTQNAKLMTNAGDMSVLKAEGDFYRQWIGKNLGPLAAEQNSKWGDLNGLKHYLQAEVVRRGRNQPVNGIEEMLKSTGVDPHNPKTSLLGSMLDRAIGRPVGVDNLLQAVFDGVPATGNLPRPQTNLRLAAPPQPGSAQDVKYNAMMGVEPDTSGAKYNWRNNPMDPDGKILQLNAPAPNYNVNGVTVPDMAGEIQQGTNALYNGPRQLNAPAHEVGAPGGVVPIFKDGKIVGYVDHGPRQGGGVVAPDMAGQIRQSTTQMNVGPRQLAAPANEVGAPGGALPIFKNGQIVGYSMEEQPRQGGGVTVPDIINRSSRGQGTPRPLITAPDPNNPGVNVLPRGVTINTSDVQGPGPFPPQPPREYATGPGGTVPIRSKETPIPLGKPGNTLGIDEHGRPVRPPTTPKAERRAAVTPAASEAEETGPSAPVKGYATNDIRKNVESQRYFSKRYSQLTEAQQELVDRRVQGLPLRLKDLGHLQ